MLLLRRLLFALLLTSTAVLVGQAPVPAEPSTPLHSAPGALKNTPEQQRAVAETITAEDLRAHLTIISADDMEGRETGEPGQKKAAAYLEQQLLELGFPAIGEDDGYFQTIRFSRQRWQEIDLQLNGESLRHLWEYASAPSMNADREAIDIQNLTFLGYGIDDPDYSDYRDTDVKGKHLLILAGEPMDKNNNYLVSKSGLASDWGDNLERKLAVAYEKGVATVFVIDPDFKRSVRTIRKESLDGRMKMVEQLEAERRVANNVILTPKLAQKIMGVSYKKIIKARKKLEKSGKLKAVTVETSLRLTQKKSVRELKGENVMGYLEGSDPELKDEILVISAHYDHIGKRGDDVIFNGADDNGSGTSTVLEVAEAFVQAKKQGMGPRRSVLFLLVSGEEKGLLGSEYYASHPIFPLEATIANINVDMVGRVDEKHADNPEYIYVIGSDRLSTELHDINEAANQAFTQLELDYTYNAEDDPNRYYYRSDHYNFAEKGIPSVFYFNGTHADYHQATDTIEKINFEKMAKIGQLIFHTAWQLTNQDRRIQVNVSQR
jgi:hypothetical protein